MLHTSGSQGLHIPPAFAGRWRRCRKLFALFSQCCISLPDGKTPPRPPPQKNPASSKEPVSLFFRVLDAFNQSLILLESQRTTFWHVFTSGAATGKAAHQITSEVSSEPMSPLLQGKELGSPSIHAWGTSHAGQSLAPTAVCPNGSSPGFASPRDDSGTHVLGSHPKILFAASVCPARSKLCALSLLT